MLDGSAISEKSKTFSFSFLICAIERNGEVFIPSGSFILRGGDVISFVASRKNAREFLKNIGFKTNQAKDTMIIGGG